MLKFLTTGGFKWIDPKEFDSNKCNNNSSKSCVLEVDLEYPEDLHEFHDDYLLAPNKAEIKRDILSSYQLRIANVIIFLLVLLKSWCLRFFTKKIMSFIMKLTTLYKARTEAKKIHRVLEFNQSQWLKPSLELNIQK